MLAKHALRFLTWQRCGQRSMQTSATRYAITKFEMPAMSPTMSEGGISKWKKKEGESFTAGDVLLEIETDKATIDVEAQEDGVLAKILAPDGSKNVKVGKLIGLLAEEGDDISNVQVPEEPQAEPPQQEVQPSPTPPPTSTPDKSQATPSVPESRTHVTPSSSRPLFPSVLRLLDENGIGNADEIKGTGVRGMLTKGDVLAYLGKASGPLGTYKAFLEKEEDKEKKTVQKTETKKEAEPAPPDGQAIRRLVASSMLEASIKARTPAAPAVVDFDDIIADYLPLPSTAKPTPGLPSKPQSESTSDLDGLL